MYIAIYTATYTAVHMATSLSMVGCASFGQGIKRLQGPEGERKRHGKKSGRKLTNEEHVINGKHERHNMLYAIGILVGVSSTEAPGVSHSKLFSLNRTGPCPHRPPNRGRRGWGPRMDSRGFSAMSPVLRIQCVIENGWTCETWARDCRTGEVVSEGRIAELFNKLGRSGRQEYYA